MTPRKHPLTRGALLAALATGLIIAAGAGALVATSIDSEASENQGLALRGCVDNGSLVPGQLTVRTAPQCPEGSTPVSWNSVGLQGPQGPVGESGDHGEPGRTGPKGEAGTPGSMGATGLPGVRGQTGTSGADGKTGADGKAGAPGAAGLEGAAGTPGLDGAPGTEGIPGAQGTPGTQGPQGPAGADGTNGTPSAITEVITGNVGVTNPPEGLLPSKVERTLMTVTLEPGRYLMHYSFGLVNPTPDWPINVDLLTAGVVSCRLTTAHGDLVRIPRARVRPMDFVNLSGHDVFAVTATIETRVRCENKGLLDMHVYNYPVTFLKLDQGSYRNIS